MRRFVPHAGLKQHATATGGGGSGSDELSPMPDLSPGHGGNSGIQELNKRLTDMKMASNQDTVRRESTYSNYWSMKSDYSRRTSQVRVPPTILRVCRLLLRFYFHAIVSYF